MRTSLVRPLFAAALVTAALAVPATPASAGCQPKVVWTEFRIYQGPPGNDIWVLLPTLVMSDCPVASG